MVANAPTGDEWVHEVKYDGYRVQALVVNGATHLFSRNGLDWTNRFGRVLADFGKLPVASAVIDGEAIVQNTSGASDFPALLRELKRGEAARILVMAFDLLHLDGEDLRPRHLIERKTTLQRVLAGLPKSSLLQFSTHIAGNGPEILRKACELRFEGLVSKRIDRPYRSGRLGDWVKAKCVMADPFVIIGWVPSAAAPNAVGSLALAYYDEGKLVYAGRVGTGFSAETAAALAEGLRRIEAGPPVLSKKLTSEQRRGVRWVEPRLVAEVAYRAWTEDDLLRHAAFQHLREDKEAAEIGKPASLNLRT